MFRIRRGDHWVFYPGPLIPEYEIFVRKLVCNLEWDSFVVSVVRSLAESIFIKNAGTAAGFSPKRCCDHAVKLINERLLERYDPSSPGHLGNSYINTLQSLLFVGDLERCNLRMSPSDDTQYGTLYNIVPVGEPDSAIYGLDASSVDLFLYSTDLIFMQHEDWIGGPVELLRRIAYNPKKVPIGGGFLAQSRIAMAQGLIDSPGLKLEGCRADVVVTNVKTGVLRRRRRYIAEAGRVSTHDPSVLYLRVGKDVDDTDDDRIVKTNYQQCCLWFVCGNCGGNSFVWDLTQCTDCMVMMYCSAECQHLHSQHHTNGNPSQCARFLHDRVSGQLPHIKTSYEDYEYGMTPPLYGARGEPF